MLLWLLCIACFNFVGAGEPPQIPIVPHELTSSNVTENNNDNSKEALRKELPSKKFPAELPSKDLPSNVPPMVEAEKISGSKTKPEHLQKDQIKKSDNSTNRDASPVEATKPKTETHSNTYENGPSPTPPLIFPKENASKAEPINMNKTNLPAREFPKTGSNSSEGVVSPTPVSVISKSKDNLNKLSKMNDTLNKNKTIIVTPHVDSIEAEDMNKHETYSGECDVDDDKHIANATNSKKCLRNSTQPKKDETKHINDKKKLNATEVLPGYNISGPQLMQKEHNVKEIAHGSDKATQPTSETYVETVAEKSAFRITRNGITIFVISITTLAVFGYVGLSVWKKVMLRRSGREILINEDEFCEECIDPHELEMNQPQSRNIIV